MTNGFTLIELLVVISIIAVLLSILMPALQSVKRRTQRIVCASNLRQMGLTAILYAQDYDDKFPYRNEYAPQDAFCYWTTTSVQGDPRSDQRWFWDGYLDGYIHEELGIASPRDRAPKVMYCPSTRKITPLAYEKSWPYKYAFGSTDSYQTSYDYCNMGAIGNVSGVSWWISRAPMPTKLSGKGNAPLFCDIVLYRDDAYGQYFRVANHFKTGAAEWIYKDDQTPEGGNSVCVDGSSRWYNFKDMEPYWGNMWEQESYWGKPN